MPARSLICIVDDDESVRESLLGLLCALGHDTQSFASAEDFLANGALSNVGCVILDATMPGMSGADLQDRLSAEERPIPIVFITARAEEGLLAQFMERGAVACLTKPFTEDDLLSAVAAASGSVASQS
jgi:FixJ family two-component response regulator